MEKVTTVKQLTSEQEAQIPGWVDKWIAKGLSTEPADREAFAVAARECYEHAGLPWQGVEIYWVKNPMEGALLAPKMHYERLCAAEGIVQTEDGLRQAVRENWTKYLGGCWWLSWQAFEGYFREVCGLTLGENLDAVANSYARAQSAAGWWWPFSSFIVVCERPTTIRLEQVRERGWGSHRLHSPDGPALAWEGWKLYFWHGVNVPELWIEAPASVKASDVLQTANIETRRAGCEILGWIRVLEELNGKVIDEDADPQIGILYSIDLPDSPNSRILKVVCGTGRVFGLPVPGTCKTAREANAWTYDLSAEELNLEIRT